MTPEISNLPITDERRKMWNVYSVPSKGLAFSVFMFLMVAIVCFLILIGRRSFLGGELGGPPVSKHISAILCISLWVIYIVMSIVDVYSTSGSKISLKCE